MNFLPQQDQIFIKKRYRNKFFILPVFLVLLFIALSILFFTHLYVYLINKNILLEKELETLNKNPFLAKFIETEESLKKINEKIKFLSDGGKTMFNLTSVIKQIIFAKKPFTGINIEYMVFEKLNESAGKIVLRGKTEKREELLNYFENLKKTDGFLKVELPTENIIKSDNIDYTINIFLKLSRAKFQFIIIFLPPLLW